MRPRYTATGLATNIRKADTRSAVPATWGIRDGNTSRPSTTNSTICISHPTPSWKRVSPRLCRKSLLPMTMPQTYTAMKPFPPILVHRP
ncbi:MAG: hypothetical protein BWX47_01528 [candidate division Hyd24-12 bacterium ADurb.Bin004]|nr:MAG: hypothetical protein BWX47_01528 [candidate division Hyd24-12 bacterium ADurb.Bin004]